MSSDEAIAAALFGLYDTLEEVIENCPTPTECGPSPGTLPSNFFPPLYNFLKKCFNRLTRSYPFQKRGA